MSFDKIFFMRNRLNENKWKADRAAYKGGDQKVIAVPIEPRTSFKVKLVNFASVLDAGGNLTEEGFNAILNWLRGQADFMYSYQFLNDLGNYFLTYEVLKDNEFFDKEVIKFEIKDRKLFNVPATTDFIRHDQLGLSSQSGPSDKTKLGTQTLNTTDKKFGKTNYGFSVPTSSAILKDNRNPKIIAFITDAYSAIKTNFSGAATHPGLPKVSKEIDAGKLGKATQAFVYALNAGFNYLDYNDRPRGDIHQELINSIADLPAPVRKKANESLRPRHFLHPNGSRLIVEGSLEDFDENAFMAGFDAGKASFADTGGVTVPSEGFQFNVTKGDAELKKLQELMRKGLQPYKNKKQVAPLVTAAVKNLGTYGTATKSAVQFLKAYGEVDGNKWPDNNGDVITPEFAAWMLRALNLVKESRSTGNMVGAKRINERRVYLAPDGFSLICEMDGRFVRISEGIDASGADDVPPPPPPPKKNPDGTVVTKDVAKANAATSDLKLFIQGGVDGYEYIVSNGKQVTAPVNGAGKLDAAKLKGFPLRRKEGTSDAWEIIHGTPTSTREVKACVKSQSTMDPAPKEKVYFMDLRQENDLGFPNNKSLYRYETAQDGKSVTWYVQPWGAPSFQPLDTTLPENAALITWLNNNYWKSATGVTQAQGAADIYKAQKEIVAKIAGWFPDEFSSFKGWNDDEDAAVAHMKSSLWPSVDTKLKALDASIELVSDEAQKNILKGNQTNIYYIPNNGYDSNYNSNSFYDKMYGGGAYADTYTIAIKDPETGSIHTTDIDTDF